MLNKEELQKFFITAAERVESGSDAGERYAMHSGIKFTLKAFGEDALAEKLDQFLIAAANYNYFRVRQKPRPHPLDIMSEAYAYWKAGMTEDDAELWTDPAFLDARKHIEIKYIKE